jgi:heme-degrading monooxygenase HmoA
VAALQQPKVLVVVYLSAPDGDVTVVEQAYRQTSWHTSGIDGLMRSELLHDVDAPGCLMVTSEWESMAAFRAWQAGPDHAKPSALRPYQDRSRGKHYVVYEVS